MKRRVPSSWRVSRSPLTVCAVMSDRTPSSVTSPDTDFTAVRSATMPETTASAETTPSSTGQSAGTDTDTVAEALRLPTQSSRPPQVSRSWTMVRVPFSRLTVSGPSSSLTSTWAAPDSASSVRPTTSTLPATIRTSRRRTPSRSRDWGLSIRHCGMSLSLSRCIASVG